ncbi:MAG: hypothetical protein ACKO1M_15335 [Planctomycetota bacterium]
MRAGRCGPLTAAAFPLPLGLSAAAMAMCLGCGGPPPVRELAGDAPPSFSEQVRAVRAGRAERIEATAPLRPDDWETLRGLAGLRVLVLERGVAGDAEAEILASLADIERLVLRGSPLSDVGFAALGRCRTLEDLNVPQAACTAVGIAALETLPNLKSLRLGGPNLRGPEVARAIAALPGLSSLHLIDVPIGDEGLAALVGLETLRNLYLDGAGVSDAAWERYFESRLNVHVHVDQAHHDRDPDRVHD